MRLFANWANQSLDPAKICCETTGERGNCNLWGTAEPMASMMPVVVCCTLRDAAWLHAVFTVVDKVPRPSCTIVPKTPSREGALSASDGKVGVTLYRRRSGPP